MGFVATAQAAALEDLLLETLLENTVIAEGEMYSSGQHWDPGLIWGEITSY